MTAPTPTRLSREQLLGEPHTPLRPPPPVVDVPAPLAPLLCVEALRGGTNWRSWERGVDLLQAAVDTGTAHSSGEEIVVQLPGSAGARYTQTFRRGEYKTRDHGFLTVTCTCPAAAGTRSICKHGVAAGLYVLGHTAGPTAASDAPVGGSPAGRVGDLDATTARQLLADAAGTHPDVAASVLAALAAQSPDGPGPGEPTAATWTGACRAAVDGLLESFDFDREWKFAGSALVDALQPLFDRAAGAAGAEGLVAVLCAAVEQASDSLIGDRYGDVGHFADRCVAELLAPARAAAVTADQQRRIATSLLAVADNPDLLSFWRCLGGEDFTTAAARAARGAVEQTPVAQLLGTAGRNELHARLQAAAATLEETRTAPEPTARAARAGREQQLRALTARHRQLGVVIGAVLAGG